MLDCLHTFTINKKTLQKKWESQIFYKDLIKNKEMVIEDLDENSLVVIKTATEDPDEEWKLISKAFKLTWIAKTTKDEEKGLWRVEENSLTQDNRPDM